MNQIFDELSRLRKVGLLTDIDLQLCRFLLSLDSNIPETVVMATSLLSYAYRQGDVCIALNNHADAPLFEESELVTPEARRWSKELAGSSVVGAPGDYKPLILDTADRLYLQKMWHYEQSLAEQIKSSAGSVQNVNWKVLEEGIGRLFDRSDEKVKWQIIAAVSSLLNRFTVISGGPGTGKTTTVVRILALMIEQGISEEAMPTVALAAPTGKAAARLKNSVVSSSNQLDVDDRVKNAIPKEAATIHQLMGARRHSSRFRYTADNPIPHDVIIIDEASMIDQVLMSKLIHALREDCRLILLGDKDQLASVEAGSILGDICFLTQNNISKGFAEKLESLSVKVEEKYMTSNSHPLIDNIILLENSFRFDEDSGIAKLADSVNRGKHEKVMELLDDEQQEDINFTEVKTESEIRREVQAVVNKFIKPLLGAKNPAEAFSIYNKFRMLSPHRRGPLGIHYLNTLVQSMLVDEGISPYEKWYPGKAVIINRNDYSLGLNNGDIGICMLNSNGVRKVFFQYERDYHSFPPARLPDHDTAYALTVHKSQGSEFDHLVLVLPTRYSKVLSRELVYTALTRAKEKVTILGKRDIFKQAINTRLDRDSGLDDLLNA